VPSAVLPVPVLQAVLVARLHNYVAVMVAAVVAEEGRTVAAWEEERTVAA